MATYYLIDDRGDVINACESSGPPRTDPHKFGGIRWDPNPPLDKLQRYRYWDERP